MESERIIVSKKERLDETDYLLLDFINILQKKTEYIIVSGYVSILLGRYRHTEDVDLLIPPMSFEKFKDLFLTLENEGYECANTSLPEEAYGMLGEHAIRFFEKGKPVPNIEFKMIRRDTDTYSFENRIKVSLKGTILFIGPLEMQIAYKLLLAADGTAEELQSDKDIEDARFMYKLYEENINKEELALLIDKLGVKNKERWLQ